MVKVADALADADYDVSVVSTQFIDWADQADRAIISSRWSRWRWTTVDYRKHGARARSTLTAVRMRAAKQFTRARGLDRIGIGTAARIRERVFPELVAEIVATRPAIVYGGGSAIAATAAAAAKLKVPFALDLEDFHSTLDAPGRYYGITEKIERQVLPEAALLTAGSRAIADAYHAKYGVDVIPIHNVFPLPHISPTPREWDGTLRLYWFGQTIGPERGIEETVKAAGLSGVESELTIRGNPRDDFINALRALADETAPRLALTFLPPAAPDDMVDLCRPYDVGVAIQKPDDRSQSLALTNKALTYILAGLAVAINDTPGQHELAVDLGEGGLVIPGVDVDVFAKGLKRWSDEPEALRRAKLASWEAATRRWNWDNPEECGRIVDAIGIALKGE
jgi:glycosyltransferase involved in cell wall biosynthesis